MKKFLEKILIDTDPGHDDAMAIILLVKSELFEFPAVTTVAGNSTIHNVTRNAYYLLSLLDRKDIPIYSGKVNPLKRELIQGVVHGKSGLDGVDKSGVEFRLTEDAPDRLIEVIEKNPGITILALGPLSNIARVLLKKPSIEKNIGRIVMMGGTVSVHGNKNRVSEFNIFVDPEAAEIVFNTNIEKVLVPLDVCNKTAINAKKFHNIKDKKISSQVKSLMDSFSEGLSKDEGTRKVLIYDAVAAYYLINPKAFKTEPMDIVIETKGEHTLGMTVAEKRKYKNRVYNTEVAMDLDVKRFEADLFNIINK